MSLETLKESDVVIGIKQVTKAVKRGLTSEVFVAEDADERVIGPLKTLCNEENITVCLVSSMKELGEAFDPPISKSAVNHRLRKLMEFAAQWQKEQDEER